MGELSAHSNEQQDFSDDLLRYVDEDGAEYFTVKQTGKSGMSQNGLAQFVQVRWTSIAKWVEKVQKADPSHNLLPDCLKEFAGRSLVLSDYVDWRGRKLLVEDFCAAMIEYYASYAKQVSEGTKIKTQQTLSLIKHLGMRVFIHNKTGWNSGYHSPSRKSDDFDLEFESNTERLKVREFLRFEYHPELRSAILEYGEKHDCLCPSLFSTTYDSLNKLLQGLRAQEIRQQNNLSRHDALRDHYDTSPLMNYSVLTRITANQIRLYDRHPREAVRVAMEIWLPQHKPQPVPIMENVYKKTKRLKKLKKQRQLAAGIQLSFELGLSSQQQTS